MAKKSAQQSAAPRLRGGGTRPPRKGRPRREDGPAVRPEQLSATLLRIAHREGMKALSMRRVAAELGVWPTAIYHYVRTKDELLDRLADAALASCLFPHAPGTPWQERVRQQCHAVRKVMLRYPGLTERALQRNAALSQGSSSANLVQEMQIALVDAGLNAEQASQALLATYAYFIGHMLMLESASQTTRNEDSLLPIPAPSEFDAHFDAGLRVLIAGIEAQVPRSRPYH